MISFVVAPEVDPMLCAQNSVHNTGDRICIFFFFDFDLSSDDEVILHLF
jgi:hypothetical protein